MNFDERIEALRVNNEALQSTLARWVEAGQATDQLSAFRRANGQACRTIDEPHRYHGPFGPHRDSSRGSPRLARRSRVLARRGGCLTIWDRRWGKTDPVRYSCRSQRRNGVRIPGPGQSVPICEFASPPPPNRLSTRVSLTRACGWNRRALLRKPRYAIPDPGYSRVHPRLRANSGA